jgi:N6-L-threonylcarbamoyladenine synthase
MRILGIESSCDETAAAIVESGASGDPPWRFASNVVASQVAIHREWGGIVPELASRQHLRDICGVVEQALGDAAVTWADVDAIAVTQGPGLVGSLLVGVAFAKAVGAARGLPVPRLALQAQKWALLAPCTQTSLRSVRGSILPRR